MRKGALLIFLISAIGCAASNITFQEACHFDLSQINNGPNLELMDSQWECVGNSGELDDFAIFSLFENNKGATVLISMEGTITYAGFTWEEIQCRDVLINAWGGFSKRRLKNIQGSREDSFLSFDIITEKGQDFVTCSLIEL